MRGSFFGWHISYVSIVFLLLALYKTDGAVLGMVLHVVDHSDYLTAGILYEVWLRRRSVFLQYIPRQPKRE